MRDREGRHGPDQRPDPRHQQHQPQYEGEMVEPREDVLDSKNDIGRHRDAGLVQIELQARIVGPQDRLIGLALHRRRGEQHVGDRPVEPLDLERAAVEIRHLDVAPLRDLETQRRIDDTGLAVEQSAADVGNEMDRDHAFQVGCFQRDVVAAIGSFLDLDITGTDLMAGTHHRPQNGGHQSRYCRTTS